MFGKDTPIAEPRSLCPRKRGETMSFHITGGYDSTITKTFRLPSHMVEKLDSIAYNNKLSLNALIVQCLEYALSQMDENMAE